MTRSQKAARRATARATLRNVLEWLAAVPLAAGFGYIIFCVLGAR
jgi:hypothetical protein